MSIPQQMAEARAVTDSLWELLRPGALSERPIPDRHRLIFYLGHLEAFDGNLLGGGAATEFDRLFEFGIDPEPGELPRDRAEDWPGEAEVRAYNSRTRERVDELLTGVRPSVVSAAIEHRLMHAETLAYLLHNLPYSSKIAPSLPARLPSKMVANPRVSIPAGVAELGKLQDGSFGWDNEYSRHCVEVPEFRASTYKITNGEYLQYVNEGGAVPHFWVRQNEEWFYRGMFELVPLPLGEPVYVTQRQASDYTAWAGGALPTEAQFHRVAAVLDGGFINAGFARWDPLPVDRCSAVVGNGWEWTQTVFAPFEGFEAFDFYPGYSANFFDGQHYVLKGASPRTAACFLRPSFRNWFRPDYPYVYATFRLVEKV